MKRSHLIAVLVGFMAIVAFADTASAYYHPGLGRFTSRDPGPARVGSGGMAAGGQFVQRDPYADGMNLYQYVRSNPTGSTDPSGLYTYFVIFYEADANKSFERAADTWIKDLQASKDWNKDCDEVVRIGVTTEADFVKAWNDIDAKIAARKGKVPGEHHKAKVGIVFSHASKTGTSGLEFKPDPNAPGSGTLARDEIKTLKALEWLDKGELRLQGCNTGLKHKDGSESVGSSFAAGQHVTTLGQAGYGYFSENATKYVEIDKNGSGTSTTVYLKAYKRGQNGSLGSVAEMPPVQVNPPSP